MVLGQRAADAPVSQDFENRFPFLVEEIVMMGRSPHLQPSATISHPRMVDISKESGIRQQEIGH